MKTILFIHGGKVENNVPSQRFRLRLDWAIQYAQDHENDEVIFFVSGRWGRVTDNFLKTEAEIGKEIIQENISDAAVIKEDVSVELIGNYAFSAPLLEQLKPDKVIIITSDILKRRVERLSEKIFASKFFYENQLLHDELSDNQILLDKEMNALALFEKLTANVADGDDAAVRDILLYKTPYYFKGIIDDKDFFDTYWPGGFDHYLHGMATRNSKG